MQTKTQHAASLRKLSPRPLRRRDALRFLVLAYNATHSTLLTRVVVKRNQRDTVGFRTGQFYPAINPLNLIPNATFGGVTSPTAGATERDDQTRGGWIAPRLLVIRRTTSSKSVLS